MHFPGYEEWTCERGITLKGVLGVWVEDHLRGLEDRSSALSRELWVLLAKDAKHAIWR